ncbi:kanadaptin [Brevipalpus obovatus]|uniref:kanadaptin n=1 Tax=Brevipalpus obovatus TaxID=246614 RepID=UPI003D9F999A
MDGDQDDLGLVEEGKEEENRSDDEFKRPASISPILSKPEADDHQRERAQVIIPEPLTSLSPPEGIFSIEVIKNGTVIQNKPIQQSRITFGRSREADFPMDHPSVSRFHSCLLWNPNDGPNGCFFLMDLNSVHGTFLNKTRIESNEPYKLSGNDFVKIGGSSRLFFLSTPRQPEENSSEEMIDSKEDEPKIKSKTKSKEDEEEGCTWGMRDDLYQEDDSAPSEFTPLGTVLSLLQTGVGSAPTKNEHAYIGNPQKTMQTWYDSEGYEFEYKVDFVNGKFKCTLNLPIDDQDVPLESEMALKKKDAIHAVCLKACQILDKAELLFPWQRSKDSRKRGDDSSDSDGDLIDETDQYKRKKAMKDAIKKGSSAENFESLNEKWAEISKELMSLKVKLANMGVQAKKVPNKDDDSDKGDALDTFMKEIVESNCTTKTPLEIKVQKSKMRLQIASLELEQRKIEKLMDIAKPSAKLPDLKPSYKESTKILQDRIKQQQTSLQSKPSLIRREVKKGSPDAAEEDEKKNSEEKASSEEPANSIEEKTDVSDFKAKIEIQIQKKKLKPIGGAASVFSDHEAGETDLKRSKMTPLPSKKDEQYGLILKKDSSKSRNPQPILNSVSSVSADKVEDYVEWLPPANQSGDGKTSLNEKFGY